MKRIKMRKTLVWLLALVMMFAAVSCGPQPSEKPTDASKPAGSVEPTESAGTDDSLKDTIVFAVDIEPPTLCGLNMSTTTTGFMVMMETTQMINELVPAPADSDYAEEVAFALITDYKLSDDELTWTFTVKDGMKFFNGDPITANDIVNTLKVLVPFAEADPKAVPKGHYQQFESVDFIDDMHFSITTYEPTPAMLRILCSFSSGVWDSKLLEEYPLEELGRTPETMNSSGPYQLKEWVGGEYILLEANPNYHTVSIHGQNAKTQYVKVVFIPESSAREAALESGEVDIAYALANESAENLKLNPDLVVNGSDDCSIINMRFGVTDEIMSNVKVRQALNYALDRNAIAQALYGDYWYEITGFSSYVLWGYLDEGYIEQDQEKAKSLLAEAGYPDGFDTEIYASTAGYKYVQLAEAISAQLAEIGVNAKVVPVENSVYQAMLNGTKMEDFKYPLFVKETGGRTREFGSVVHTWYTTSPDGTNTLNNNGFYSNAEVDRLAFEANATMDDDARVALFKEIQHIMYVEDPPQVNIAGLVNVWAHTNKVDGVWMNSGGVIELDETVVHKK